ncbi:hypothetical protein B0T10DRAFT_510869 [Thelonectria olida]|uniref:ATP-dependent DNA ligase family profile domain-containing protein n=1 Tax=Thelonectria olida TaxID=1576542 RepID=A0A9P8WAA4_9HYPO|nr:hypothetical protein B0T10DRAFT_510869 [Thelonectria olida]
MPLPFYLVCELLESSHKLSVFRQSNAHVVSAWFTRHRDRINAHDTNLAALLSTLLPDKRTDRVYCIQARSLEKIIGRAFFLGSSRIAELTQYRQPGLCIDLADCVARILNITPNPSFDKAHQVTVEEIDETLHYLAAKVKWSSPAIRASQATLTQGGRTDLEKLFRRFNAMEAKWFTRLILKDYQPLVLDPHLVYRLCDPTLPSVLKIYDDFTTAINAVEGIRGRLLPTVACKTPREQLLSTIKPRLGVKVGRQQWLKGRSIKHCLDMGHGRMSVEDKIDGEYCQVHIDLSRGNQCIQIFSKSGKDSTEDRDALHGAIKESLRIGGPDIRIKEGCILEGELVAYDDSEHKILPFHKIRKHVSRRGRFLNTEQDSLPGPHEHLMIIYYDILLLDGQSFISSRRSERFTILSNLISCRTGWAELVHREVIDFGHSMGASSLRKAFARVILSRKEGLVLRPDDPYFDFADIRRPFSSSCIKLKKEYIGNFGDVGDFAIVGARYDTAKARTYRIAGLKWTHFYLGCLDNREQVKTWNAKPEFTVVNVVELNETMLRDVVSYGDHESIPFSQNDRLNLKLTPGVEQGMPMDVVFIRPMVFDLRCFSFDRVGNTGFWSLRFPSVTKVHFDRDFTDTVSFEQLQEMAKDSTTAKDLEDSQENLQWIAKLEGADPRGAGVDALSQLTMTTMPTPSPRRSSQNSTVSWSPSSPIVARRPVSALESPRRVLFGNPQPSAANQVATPPTSSAPRCTSPTTEKGCKNKRGSSSIGPSAPRKRRKSGQSTEQHDSKTIPRQTPQTLQTRKPLADINGNSQSSLPSLSPIPLSDEDSEPEIIDLTSSPGASFTTAAHQSSPAGGLELADMSSQPVQPDETHQSSSSSPSECKYLRNKCWLSKAVILVHEEVTSMQPDVKKFLREHGIPSPVQDIDAWLAQDEARARSSEKWEPGPTKIWFIDSVEQPAETQSRLRIANDRREDLPRDKRDWISVYDWRVLKYLTILEDDQIEEKYYDGWHDPWRRWYCGIV